MSPESASGAPLGHETPAQAPEDGSAQRISPTGHMTTPAEALARNPRSLRLAINAKCWDCQGGDADPAPRKRIGTCGCTTCPLHAVRPYQRGEVTE